MADSRRLLVWLAWALAAAVVLSAIGQLLFVTGAVVSWPDPSPGTNIVDAAQQFRAFDVRVFPLVFFNDIVGIVGFTLIALLGIALRPFAIAGTGRDILATVLVIAGVVGLVAQFLDLAIASAATHGYCDCGFKNEEVIAQDYALEVGRNVQFWIIQGSFAFVGIGAALAGRLVPVSSNWRLLAYLIAILLLLTAAIRLLLQLNVVNLNVDVGMYTDLASAVATGILVPIWAVLLARSVRGVDAAPAD